MCSSFTRGTVSVHYLLGLPLDRGETNHQLVMCVGLGVWAGVRANAHRRDDFVSKAMALASTKGEWLKATARPQCGE